VTNKSRDVFADSFYYRAIRTKIGEELRTRLAPTEPAPDRILKALQALEKRADAQIEPTTENDRGPSQMNGSIVSYSALPKKA
jgi:hypothetical protein